MAVKVAIAIALIERLYGQGSGSEIEIGRFDGLGDQHKHNVCGDYQRKTTEIQTKRQPSNALEHKQKSSSNRRALWR